MTSRPLALGLLVLAGCYFPTEGVPLGDVDADTCVPAAETCDGDDNDCDGLFDEGFASGDPCDGPDADLCPDDAMVCNDGGGEVCGDTSGDDNLELCNGPDLDEDCDGATDEGYTLGACDGGDTDMCTEGTATCAPDGLGVVCGDATGNTVETCDGDDDDCDGVDDNGFDTDTDEANCGECGNPCTNPRGTTACLGGTCTPTCNNGAAECNGDPDDGCELQDSNPLCAGALVIPALIVNGDAGDTDTIVGTTERFVLVRLNESDNGGDVDITGRFTLASGAGTDFDLFVHCLACSATPKSDAAGPIEVGRADGGGDRSFDVIVEVRYDPATPSTTCAPWTVTITGGITTLDRCGSGGVPGG